MRAIILGLGISLDGYIARLDGSVDFLFMPKDYSMGPFFKTINCAIMRRKTYDIAKTMGGREGKMETYVMTPTLPAGERSGMIFTSDSPEELLQRISQKNGKNIWIM